MTSRRAASTASHPAPAAPRIRWAAALAVAYLAVAGCAAQADSANQAAVQAAASSAAVATPASSALLPPPSQLYGDLFVAVQTAQLYPDQKTFVDATPDTDPATIVQLYQQQKSQPGFSLKAFVDQHFTPPP
ncbi:alpha,alpha-trehalase, partial [Burkholderia sp. TJI49]